MLTRSHDKPIESEEEDILTRVSNGKTIARKILEVAGESSSQVFAIHGSWGAGKTSLKNLVKNQISNSGSDLIVYEFCPWYWTGQIQLNAVFLHEVKSVIIKSLEIDKKQFESSFNSYTELLEKSRIIMKASKIILPFFGTIGSVLSASADSLISNLGEMVDSRKLAKGITGELESNKNTINKILSKSNRNYLIIIDDIDRLLKNEILEMFKMVHLFANFSNINYLLIYDKQVAIRSISEYVSDPYDYEEKIVQIEFHLLNLSNKDIDSILFPLIDELFESVDMAKVLDKSRWSTAYYEGFKKYFKTIRAIKRYINKLEYTLSLFKCGSMIELDPVDLMSIEAIRMFDVEVYGILSKNKELLTIGTRGNPNLSLDENTELIGRQSDLYLAIMKNSYLSKYNIHKLILSMFPSMKKASKTSEYEYGVYFSNDKNRISEYNYFDAYFHENINYIIVEKRVVRDIVDNAETVNEIVDILRSIKHENTRELFRVMTREENLLSYKNIVNGILAMMEYADERNNEDNVELFLESPISHYMVWCINANIRNQKPGLRKGIILSVMSRTENINMALHLLEAINSERNSNKGEKHEELYGEVNDDIVNSLRVEIIEKAKKQESKKYDKMRLYHSYKKIDKEKAKIWLHSMLDDENRALSVIRDMEQVVRSGEGTYKTIPQKMIVEEIGIERAHTIIDKMKNKHLKDEDAELVEKMKNKLEQYESDIRDDYW